MEELVIFWHRRDIRMADNAGLYHALQSGHPVLPLFIFDRNILDLLEDRDDRRVHFIHHYLHLLQEKYRELGSGLLVEYGNPLEIWQNLLTRFAVKAVYTNHDYEPYALKRDGEVRSLLEGKGIPFRTYKDQCIFEKLEVAKDDGKPYTVFTPYSKKWMARLNHTETNEHFRPYPTETLAHNLYRTEKPFLIPSLEAMGFSPSDGAFPKRILNKQIIAQYAEQRDFPAVQGTTRLSVHLRFGTVSIRQLVVAGLELSQKWLNELIWRDFYMMILSNFPHVATENFNPKYHSIPWRNNPEEFEAWCQGNTGYPIVDAGMRELNATGFMHNRVRMVTASFLTKHLLIDWRWGEAYFARKLLDFELASNNGGWQWAAGTGTDAQPYFRVFNPESQAEKFDKQLAYVRKWVPEFQEFIYSRPIVPHAFARQRAIDTYKKALEEA
jgi:deoxyribodipyrimidine photo-lyase